jgi:hypothetical protein
VAGYYIKVFIDELDDPRIGQMPDWVFRRFKECQLVAKAHDRNGLLPPVGEVAWRLRLKDETTLSEALQVMQRVGVARESSDGWILVDFAREQAAVPGSERMKRSRYGSVAKRHDECDEDVTKRNNMCDEVVTKEKTASISSSSSSFSSDSRILSIDSYDSWDWIPDSPREAEKHPGLRLFMEITGGALPGSRDYKTAIDWLALTGKKLKLAPQALKDYMKSYLTAWTSQTGRNGRNYDALNLAWMQKAFNGESLDAARPPAADNVKRTGAIARARMKAEGERMQDGRD